MAVPERAGEGPIPAAEPTHGAGCRRARAADGRSLPTSGSDGTIGEERATPSSRRLPVLAGLGLVAATAHAVVAWALVGGLGGLPANAIGFLAAVAVNQTGHGLLIACPSALERETVVRTVVVSAVTLGISEWTFAFFDAMGAAEARSILLAAVTAALVWFVGLLFGWGLDGRSAVRAPLRTWLVDVGVWVGAAGIGVAALVAMAPDGLLDPTSAAWRLPSGDRGTNVAGMRYFLVDDWYWPLLRTDDLDTPDGTIVASPTACPSSPCSPNWQ